MAHYIPVFQESFVRIDPPPSPSAAALLQNQGIHVPDHRGIMIEDSIANLAKLIQYSSQTSASGLPVVAVSLGLLGLAIIIAIWAFANYSRLAERSITASQTTVALNSTTTAMGEIMGTATVAATKPSVPTRTSTPAHTSTYPTAITSTRTKPTVLPEFNPVDAVVVVKANIAYSAYHNMTDYIGTTEMGYYYLGAKDAPVVVEEFASFSCIHCYNWNRDVFKKFQDKIQAGEVKFVFIPLTRLGSFDSEPMAKAALCAGEQGKFWEMQDVLLDWLARYGQTSNDSRRLATAANALGLDIRIFNICIKSSTIQDKIKVAADDATKRGISGAPTVFINGENIGVVGLKELRSLIEVKMAAKKS